MNPWFTDIRRGRSWIAPAQSHVGDVVEVRSATEILATLDPAASIEAMPFMPEMLQFCGRQFRVSKSAHKVCDTIATGRNRRLAHSYYLEDLRCDGRAHGGCDAACLLVWKSAWLKRVDNGARHEARPAAGDAANCDVAALQRGTRPDSAVSDGGDTRTDARPPRCSARPPHCAAGICGTSCKT